MGPLRGCSRFAFVGRAGLSWGNIAEHYHLRAAQSGRFPQRLYCNIDALDSSAGQLHLKVLQVQRFALLRSLTQSVADGCPQTFPHHGMKIPVGLACGRFQVLSSAPTDIDDIAFIVDHDCSRSVDLQ